MKNNKRLFFGLEVQAPWSHPDNKEKTIQHSYRHVTIAFLGNIDFTKIEQCISSFPLPTFSTGLTGIFDKCIFLPTKHPRLVAWQIDWLNKQTAFENYLGTVQGWLENHHLPVEKRKPFLSHVTICRKPSSFSYWRKSFTISPLYISNLHLYESLGNSHYKPCWTFNLSLPFEEIEHTADIAYIVKGINFYELYLHGALALAFKHPSLLNFFNYHSEINDLDDVVIALNKVITQTDANEGCPFKAISFHGKLEESILSVKNWEMVVDV